MQVRSFKFILLLEIFVNILAITNELSEQLQDSQLDLGAAARLVCSVTKAISNARQDKEWDRTWTAAIDRAQSSNADLPTVGRSRQRPRQIDDFVLMESTGRRDQQFQMQGKTKNGTGLGRQQLTGHSQAMPIYQQYVGAGKGLGKSMTSFSWNLLVGETSHQGKMIQKPFIIPIRIIL